MTDIQIDEIDFPKTPKANLNMWKEEMKDSRIGRRQFMQHFAAGVTPAASSNLALGADSTPLRRPTGGPEGLVGTQTDDYTSGRVFEDAVCYAFYPVDLHMRSGVNRKPSAEGTVPTTPLTALVPKGCGNIIVAGRCVSSDRLANSVLRVQASCMAMSQAAGAAAALAVRENSTPLDVPLEDIREMPRKHGAIIPTV